MKNIIKKISCLVAVVVIVLASFILPASAAEADSGVLYVDFLKNYNDVALVDKHISDASFVSSTGYLMFGPKYSQGHIPAPHFYISASSGIDFASRCFGVDIFIDNITTMPNSIIGTSIDGKQVPLFKIQDQKLYNVGGINYTEDQVWADLSTSGSLKLSMYIDLNSEEWYFRVGENADWYIDYIDGITNKTANTLFFFETTDVPSNEILSLKFSKFRLYEMPIISDAFEIEHWYDNYASLMSRLIDSADVYDEAIDIGYASGISDGYKQGFIEAFESGKELLYSDYIDFLEYSEYDPNHDPKRIQAGFNDLVAVMPQLGVREIKVYTDKDYGGNISGFYISNRVSMELNNDWYGFIFEFDSTAMFDGGFVYRQDNVECHLLRFLNNEIYLFNGDKLFTLSSNGKCQIACMVNVVTNDVYISVDNTCGDSVIFDDVYNMSLYFKQNTSYSNRYCSFFTNKKQSFAKPNMTITKMLMYDIPYENVGVSMSDYFNSYSEYVDYFISEKLEGKVAGYKQGLADGYEDGISVSDNYDLGFAQGKDVGYEQGKDAGYKQGKEEYYNDLYEKGLEAIDENEGTLMQGFLSGMWNGVQNFVQELLDGITFSDLSLRKIVTTLLAIVLAAFIIRLVKG